MKISRISLFVVLLFSSAFFASCNRGITRDQILAMPDGPVKDSTLLYYHTGMVKGQMVVPVDTFFLSSRAKPEYKDGVNLYQSAKVVPGDSLMLLGGINQTITKKGNFRKNLVNTAIQLRLFRDGHKVADGWLLYNESSLANPKASSLWNIIFSSISINMLLTLFVFALAVAIVYWIWKFIYKRVTDPFWEDSSILCQTIYFILSAAVAVIYFFIKLDDSLLMFLRFNPDFFAHWSQYPILVKVAPFVVGLWLLSIIGMLWEMICKYSTLWLLIYFPGKLSLGVLIIVLMMMVSNIILLALPTIIGIIVVICISGVGGATSGGGGGGGSSSSDISQQNMFRDDSGNKHMSGVDRDAANKKIRGE